MFDKLMSPVLITNRYMVDYLLHIDIIKKNICLKEQLVDESGICVQYFEAVSYQNSLMQYSY